jgi:RNA polymerase sigma factor (sigma-70 family)
MTLAKTAPGKGWTDDQLVRACRKGDARAWAALIEKYKNLIFSIPIKFGLPPEDAADVFQTVCSELLVGLSELREPKALPKWLIQTSYHQCLRWKKERTRLQVDAEAVESEATPADILPENILTELQREQSVRDAIAQLPERCNRMVTMLFFEDPPRSYDEVAKQLQLATGSIGFIRGRCLKKLRQILEEKGFR